MKKRFITAIAVLFIWVCVSIWFLIKTKKDVNNQIDFSLMVIQDYAENVRYSICVENIAYWQHRDYKRCEKLWQETLEDIDYYYRKFPLFFKNMN